MRRERTRRRQREQRKQRCVDSQSSQVKCAFWQWKQARLAFFFFGPSRVRDGGWEDEDSASLGSSVDRLRLHCGFFFCSRAEGLAVREDGSPGNAWVPATWLSMERPREEVSWTWADIMIAR